METVKVDKPLYHGTSVLLKAEDILLPGAEIDHTVHQRSEFVYATNDILLAVEFGCYSADLYCLESLTNNSAHYDHYSGYFSNEELYSCVYLYEINPLGEVTHDMADDLTVGKSFQMPAARIIRRVNEYGSKW